MCISAPTFQPHDIGSSSCRWHDHFALGIEKKGFPLPRLAMFSTVCRYCSLFLFFSLPDYFRLTHRAAAFASGQTRLFQFLLPSPPCWNWLSNLRPGNSCASAPPRRGVGVLSCAIDQSCFERFYPTLWLVIGLWRQRYNNLKCKFVLGLEKSIVLM